MSISIVLSCLWALAALATTWLPRRRQGKPGAVLLILAPVLFVWVGQAHGLWVAASWVLAAVLMFQGSLLQLIRRAADPMGSDRSR